MMSLSEKVSTVRDSPLLAADTLNLGQLTRSFVSRISRNLELFYYLWKKNNTACKKYSHVFIHDN